MAELTRDATSFGRLGVATRGEPMLIVRPVRHVRMLETVDRESAHAEEIAVALESDAGQALFGFALRLGLRSEQADDAVQEVLLRVFRALSRGEAIDDARAWAFRTLYRIVMDEHRLRRRLEGLRERLLAQAQATAASDQAIGTSIWAEVEALPARQRQVLFLHYQADLAFDEVARIMGITPGGARAVAARGVETLRRRLASTDREE